MASVSLTASGIDYSDYQTPSSAGSMSSELLDSYEEGTWSPEWRGTAGTAGTSSTSGAGDYTKTGRMVKIAVQAGWQNKGDWDGQMLMFGIPFTVGSGQGNYGNGIMLSYCDNMTYTDPLKIYGYINLAYLKFFQGGEPGSDSGLDTDAVTGVISYLSFTSFYEV